MFLFSFTESLMNFEELKKENEKFMSLRKQFARGLQIEDVEESDNESERNLEKIAYERRVRRFTKPPPALKPKTSLTFEDRRELGLAKYPDPSAAIDDRKMMIRCSKKHKKRRKSGDLLDESRRNSVQDCTPVPLDTGLSSTSEYYQGK